MNRLTVLLFIVFMGLGIGLGVLLTKPSDNELNADIDEISIATDDTSDTDDFEEGLQFDFNNAYAYATTKVQKNGAAFMTITSREGEDQKIIAASSPVADRAELHTHIMDGDTMMMREVESYDVPAGGTLTLEPTAHHIMLMDLKAPLAAGESFPLTLTTEDGQYITVAIVIQNPGGAPLE